MILLNKLKILLIINIKAYFLFLLEIHLFLIFTILLNVLFNKISIIKY